VRIAIVCAYDLDAPGGVQVHVHELAGQLAERGHVVEVLGPGRGKLGAPVRVPYRGTVAPIAPWPSGVRRARRVLGAFAADLVHVHEPFTPSASMWASLAAPSPVVATFHAWLDRSRIYEAAGPFLRPVRRRLAAAIAVSEAAAGFVRRVMPDLDPVVIPNGLSVARFAGARPLEWPAGRRIAWVHRLDRQKGFPVMVEAFRRVARDRDDVVLTVAGDGADRGAIETLPDSLRSRVFMLGPLQHDRIPLVLAGADVAVAAATGQESFGYSIVEAMAAGVPVVATDIEGYRQVATSEVDALLVPPGDPEALAAAIRRILDDEALSMRLAEAGRRTAASFDWGMVTDRIEAVYRSALEPSSLR
jgi:phosphatidylinositol alpha-mannosyltransferase